MSADALPLEHVSIEPRADSSGKSPAVFIIHGRGADEEDLLPIAHQRPDALHVVSLRAPDPLMGGYTWYELDLSEGGLHGSQPHDGDFERSLDLASASIEAAVEAYDLDPARIGLLGFSQGAIMSLALLLDDPGRYAWVAALHGYLPASHADRSPSGIESKPVFVGAGTADEIIPATRGERAAESLRELGADVTFHTYEIGHGVGREEARDVVAFVEEHA